MTVFSRFLINPQRRGARKLLSSPQAMHAAVLAAFPPGVGDGGRVLWRLDAQPPEYRLYVLGPEEPDFTHLVEQAGWATRTWESMDYAPMLARITPGQEWGFRLTANPVKSLHRPGQRGKPVPHVTEAQQIAWLDERAGRHGFELRRVPSSGAEGSCAGEGMPDVRVTGREDLSFAKRDTTGSGRRRQVTLRRVRFDGTLRVLDAEAVRAALVQGIGRGKAYGCGVLTLRPVNQEAS